MVTLVMMDTITRVIFGEARPIDITMLIVELLVLAVIAYESIAALWRKRNIKKRMAVLFKLLAEGQTLQESVPSSHNEADVGRSAQEVDGWIKKTSGVLKEYSLQAATSFNQGVDVVSSNRRIATGAQPGYGSLAARLENLRRITEKSEVYY